MNEFMTLKMSRVVKSIVFDYAVLFAAMAAGVASDNVFFKLSCGLVIARQFHALAILFHEGAHYNLSRNRVLNDFISDWVVGAMQFFSIKAYRVLHARHHSHLLTQKDPDFRLYNDFPMNIKTFLTRRVLKDLMGVSAPKILTYFNFPKEKEKLILKKYYIDPHSLLRGGLWLTLVSAALLTFGSAMDIVYLWLIPLLCFFPIMLRLRAVMEHGGLSESHEDHGVTGGTRTIKSFLANILICPHNIGYHTEHHLQPAVPYYNLPKVNEWMLEKFDTQELNVHDNLATVFQQIFVPNDISPAGATVEASSMPNIELAAS